MKSTKEFRALDPKEIKSRLDELNKELMKENVQISSGTAPKNPGKVRQIKKNRARLLTILKQKEVNFK